MILRDFGDFYAIICQAKNLVSQAPKTIMQACPQWSAGALGIILIVICTLQLVTFNLSFSLGWDLIRGKQFTAVEQASERLFLKKDWLILMVE